MAKAAGRLTKIKSALRRWPSMGGRLGRASSGRPDEQSAAVAPAELHPVYVGKSRRLFLVGSDVVGHPLFRELVHRGNAGDGEAEGALVACCEVVLFEHLLWMLENAVVEGVDDLVDFYTC